MNAPLHHVGERTWAIVPVKSFARAKSRLGPQTGPVERRLVARALFARVLAACANSSAFERVLVATDGADVERACAGMQRVSVLRDPSPREPLAAVARRALEHAHARGATRAVLVMSDLPGVRAHDLDELSASLARAALVLAPDRARRGLGALACALPCPVRLELGHRDSFGRNVRAAQTARTHVLVLSNPRLAVDVDTSLDLEQVARAQLGSPI